MCPVHQNIEIMNKVYAGELKSSPPLDNLQQGAIQDAMDPEVDEETIFSPSSAKCKNHSWSTMGGYGPPGPPDPP